MQVLASYDRYISIGEIVYNSIPMVRTVSQKTEKTLYQFLASHGGYISILRITYRSTQRVMAASQLLGVVLDSHDGCLIWEKCLRLSLKEAMTCGVYISLSVVTIQTYIFLIIDCASLQKTATKEMPECMQLKLL